MAKPGTNQAVFFELHGVLLHPWRDREDYVRPRFVEGALQALARFDPERFFVFIATNQCDVAFGRLRERDFKRFQENLQERLQEAGVRIRKLYACLYHPRGKGRWKKESVFRKPNIGMFKMAEQEFDLNLRRSWVVGAASADILAGDRAGLGTVMIGDEDDRRSWEYDVKPHYYAPDLRSACERILAFETAMLH